MRQICTKERPMPRPIPEGTRWSHPDAIETGQTDYQSAYGSYDEYSCPNCGKTFWVELPD